MKESDIRLRPERDSDIPLLRKIYATTRIDIALSDLPQFQKEQFLDNQFKAQWQCYHSNYANAEFLIIEKKRKAIGRLYLSRMPTETRVIDIMIAAEYRNQGIGSALLRAVQTEAKMDGRCVTLHAEKMGGMAEYYKKLGFQIEAEQEAHHFMRWAAGSSVLVT